MLPRCIFKERHESSHRANSISCCRRESLTGASLMPDIQLRKRLMAVEEVFHDGGPPPEEPLRRAAALTVIQNPFSGRYVKEIAGFMDDLKPLGLEMATWLIAALGGDPPRFCRRRKTETARGAADGRFAGRRRGSHCHLSTESARRERGEDHRREADRPSADGIFESSSTSTQLSGGVGSAISSITRSNGPLLASAKASMLVLWTFTPMS